ncbi:MAG: DUF488 family protein [Kiritimatiellae bacterium]|nr:DUF488 family protein [Kiritimatiellia bacterium]
MASYIERVYEVGEKQADEYRVLVDRIWPRGIKKKELDLDEWLKEIAPSNELRKWFGHDSGKWKPFKTQYLEELIILHRIQLSRLAGISRQSRLMLLYSAKDIQHNQAIVIQEAILNAPPSNEECERVK